MERDRHPKGEFNDEAHNRFDAEPMFSEIVLSVTGARMNMVSVINLTSETPVKYYCWNRDAINDLFTLANKLCIHSAF